jgi:hypothetical protein
MPKPRTEAGQRLLDRLIKSRFFNDPDLVIWIEDIEREASHPIAMMNTLPDILDWEMHTDAIAAEYARLASADEDPDPTGILGSEPGSF